MSLSDIASTSQGPMVGDYISTSFNASGQAVPVFAIGNAHASGQPFDEAMYAPAAPLAVASTATNPSTSAGAVTGQGTGTAVRSLRER
jgi:hypothetical protein